MTPKIHLFWLWDKHPTGTTPAQQLKETSLGFAVCGEINVPRAKLTVFKEDTTCDKCLEKAKRAA